jgi:HAE1 family hydrophobic/amphiphilic exporter-1
MAEIRSSLQDKTSYSRYNGKENISISIQKQADANTVRVAKAVKAGLAELKPSLPSNVKVEVVYDESIYVVEALDSMTLNVILGGLLAFGILYFFLGNVQDATK